MTSPLVLLAALTLAANASRPAAAPPFLGPDSIRWPEGTEVLHFENLEGAILLTGTLRGSGGRDTSGLFALDTGAGYLAVDLELARQLGVADSAATAQAVDLTQRPMPRFLLGGWSMEQLEPVLTVDAAVVRRVTDRAVLGLLGQKPLRDRALWIDYRKQIAAFIPAGPPAGTDEPAATSDADDRDRSRRVGESGVDSLLSISRRLLAPTLTTRAVPVRFRLVGDGKILVHGRVTDPRLPRWSKRLDLLVDTGATKCVLFEESLGDRMTRIGEWKTLRGLTAPTLIGAAAARMARIPALELEAVGGPLRVEQLDAGVIRSELSQVLSRATRRTVHGLIGYSLLKRFRVVVDYPHRVLWLDPIPSYRDDRPFEYCHVGLQLERREGAVVVSGVALGSPAARVGIAPGDQIVALGAVQASAMDLTVIGRRMEGRPGTPVTLTLRRGTVEHTYRLTRRRLL